MGLQKFKMFNYFTYLHQYLSGIHTKFFGKLTRQKNCKNLHKIVYLLSNQLSEYAHANINKKSPTINFKVLKNVIHSSTLHATISQEQMQDNVSDFHHTSFYITFLQQGRSTPHRNMTRKLCFTS